MLQLSACWSRSMIRAWTPTWSSWLMRMTSPAPSSRICLSRQKVLSAVHSVSIVVVRTYKLAGRVSAVEHDQMVSSSSSSVLRIVAEFLLVTTGPEMQKSRRKAQRGGSKDTTTAGSTMQESGPLAPSCLPGLYKSKQLPSINAEDLSASSSSESDGPTISPRKACRAPAKHHLSSEAALAGEHASLQKSIRQKSLEERSNGMALNMQRQLKRQGRQSLPGRLRKKLAKEQRKGGGALCKRNEGHA